MTTATTSTLCGLALAVLMAGSTFPAQAEEPGDAREDGLAMRIGFRDLDLSVAEDVAELYSRIKSAARLVCTDSASPWDAKRMEYFENCYAAAVAEAVERIDQPQLIALHQHGEQPVRIGAATP